MVEAVTVFIKVILHADHVILFLHPNKIIRVERPNHDRISHREKTGKGSGGLVVIRLAPIRKTRQKSRVDGAASPPPAGGREEGRKDGDENSPVDAAVCEALFLVSNEGSCYREVLYTAVEHCECNASSRGKPNQ